MASSNQFLTFATAGGAYVLSNAAYQAASFRPTGYPPGLLTKEALNTAVRQGTFVAAALSQFYADQGNQAVNDDGSVANYVIALKRGERNFVATDSYLTDTGAANAYVVAFSPTQPALVAGQQVAFLAANSNTGASTLNAGPGAIPLRRSDGTALSANDIPAGTLVTVRYDAVNGWWRVTSVVFSQLGSLTGARYVSSNTSVSVGTYVMNSLAGAFTLTLPPSPATGDTITLIDLVNYCGVNNVTVARNGNTIMSAADDLVIDVGNQQFTLWYNGTTWKLA